MPLASGSSQEVISANIAQLVKEGYSHEQASAIAYKQAGRDAESVTTSKRTVDRNGYWHIEGNPISKVGVFPYSGAQVGLGFAPDEIVNVFRGPEELADVECLESFKLVPLIDEHLMLGAREEGMTPAEEKGVLGVIGENIYFDGEYIRANLRLFAEKIKKLIENGKKELSAGYWCVYERVEGVYNGLSYQVVQRKIRSNHLALVENGRMGPDVAVLDTFTFTIDQLEFKDMAEEVVKKEITEGDADNTVEARIDRLEGRIEDLFARLDGIKKEESQDEFKETIKEEKDEDSTGEAVDSKLKSFDSRLGELEQNVLKQAINEISSRDKLASDLSKVVGTFDHADKTLTEVAKYGLEKLKITAMDGQEVVTLQSYLAGRNAALPSASVTVASDSKPTTKNEFDSFLEGVKG